MVALLVVGAWISAVGCASTGGGDAATGELPPRAAALRAALAHHFEADVTIRTRPYAWILVVDADDDTKAVVEALRPYPVTAEKPARLGGTAIRRQDLDSGKFVALWSAEVTRLDATSATVFVTASFGGRSGFRVLTHLERGPEGWKVVGSEGLGSM